MSDSEVSAEEEYSTDDECEYMKVALQEAAEKNDITQVEELLAQGVNVDIRDSENATPLHFVSKKNIYESHLKVAELLLKSGADINAKDAEGRSPLFHLVDNCSLKMLELFLNFKANVNEVSYNGNNILFSAVQNKHTAVTKFLIDLGLNINHQNIRKQTPLYSASLWRDDSLMLMKFLLKNGANINIADNDGNTPLIYLITYMRVMRNVLKRKLKFLLDHYDFNVFYGGSNIFDINYKLEQDFMWKITLEHIVKLQSLDVPVHSNVLDAISSQDNFNDYYKQCHEELMRAKSTKLKNSWLTFYNLLVGDRKKLKNYAGNNDLIKELMLQKLILKKNFQFMECQ